MLNTLQKWLDSLDIDPEKTSLRNLLPTINVVLVLLVIFGISFSAIGLLRKLANEQGLSQVQLAGAGAREELRKLSEDTLKQTRNLAGNATLQRLLQNQAPDLGSVLKRNCDTSGMDACAVLRGDIVVVHTGAGDAQLLDDAFWSAIATAAQEQGERFSAVPSAVLPAVIGSSAELRSDGISTRLFAVRLLNEKLARQLSERVGHEVQLVNYRAFSSATANDYTRLNSAALSDGRSASERLDGLDVFAASVPIFASSGEAIALIQTTLTTEASDANIRSLTNRLLITAVVVAVLAILVSLLLGQLVARPVQNLTNAALRLAQGDFSTSIPTGGPAEIGVLSRTMENMRRNLVDITGTLRRREAEAQAVLSGTIEGVYAVDKLRRITYINPQGARMLGLRAEEVIGKFCGDVLNPCVDKQGNRPCDAQCPILQARSSNSAQATERLQIGQHLGNGRVVSAVITSAALVDGLQVQVLRDETELEAIRRARDSVLANISHEFRTPLAAQLASIELLLDGLEHMPTEQTRELVLSLERSTQRLTALIDNLLESVRIEAGQLSIRQQSVAMSEVAAEARTLVGALLAQRGQQLLIDVSDDLPTVNGDELRLTQVLVNLLANACKYAPQNSIVRVGAEVLGEQLNVWVEDEGPGVPEIQLGSIFDRFSRGPEQEPEPGGLGLGLWIVKSIIDRHGGRITALRTPQQRTRFSFTLPMAQGL